MKMPQRIGWESIAQPPQKVTLDQNPQEPHLSDPWTLFWLATLLVFSIFWLDLPLFLLLLVLGATPICILIFVLMFDRKGILADVRKLFGDVDEV